MDVLTGAGEVVTASPTEHPELFRAFPNSYGTLGYSVRLRIELEPVHDDDMLPNLHGQVDAYGWYGEEGLPPGEYTIAAGVYNPADGARLPAERDGQRLTDDVVPLGSFVR